MADATGAGDGAKPPQRVRQEVRPTCGQQPYDCRRRRRLRELPGGPGPGRTRAARRRKSWQVPSHRTRPRRAPRRSATYTPRPPTRRMRERGREPRLHRAAAAEPRARRSSGGPSSPSVMRLTTQRRESAVSEEHRLQQEHEERGPYHAADADDQGEDRRKADVTGCAHDGDRQRASRVAAKSRLVAPAMATEDEGVSRRVRCSPRRLQARVGAASALLHPMAWLRGSTPSARCHQRPPRATVMPHRHTHHRFRTAPPRVSSSETCPEPGTRGPRRNR